ncbi:MAG: hypothetical protein K6A65_01915 [Succinivibrionaceae bacterium]|nr:hypothetical protein [Succinivibrionaceae bacterium]
MGQPFLDPAPVPAPLPPAAAQIPPAPRQADPIPQPAAPVERPQDPRYTPLSTPTLDETLRRQRAQASQGSLTEEIVDEAFRYLDNLQAGLKKLLRELESSQRRQVMDEGRMIDIIADLEHRGDRQRRRAADASGFGGLEAALREDHLEGREDETLAEVKKGAPFNSGSATKFFAENEGESGKALLERARQMALGQGELPEEGEVPIDPAQPLPWEDEPAPRVPPQPQGGAEPPRAVGPAPQPSPGAVPPWEDEPAPRVPPQPQGGAEPPRAVEPAPQPSLGAVPPWEDEPAPHVPPQPQGGAMPPRVPEAAPQQFPDAVPPWEDEPPEEWEPSDASPGPEGDLGAPPDFYDDGDGSFDYGDPGAPDYGTADAAADYAGRSPEEGVPSDGDPTKVPPAIRQRLEMVSRVHALPGTKGELPPEAFLDEVATQDPFTHDILLAGYRRGQEFSALCHSSREIDPSDPGHWILRMSPDFEIFARDPEFTHNIEKKFSIALGHAVRIEVVLGGGERPDTPLGLMQRRYLERFNEERRQLAGHERLASLFRSWGEDLDTVPMTLYALADDPGKEKGE